ncbi:MAG: ribonuclease P protein component, partial [Methylococcales bacterium]|nr:ribonuclease P protein component [Methylococcales bacterium]
RESFRLQQHQLTNLDVVVLARRDAANATSIQLANSLAKHWQYLVTRCARY